MIVLCLCMTLTFNEKRPVILSCSKAPYILWCRVYQRGFDQTAQVMKSVLEQEKLVNRPVNILYQRGGTVDKGWTYMMERSQLYQFKFKLIVKP